VKEAGEKAVVVAFNYVKRPTKHQNLKINGNLREFEMSNFQIRGG
jgi:hypothetical protein